ncbi:hypothetical protein PQJ75_00845 [Rhodoplanes sp. TEM]|uniref:Uncharacterized protein n=1 Tax=Rhodoplanes tepidamans TaxID=200616 RepID=A0ABT5J573_RHOTP|nr:MULTISPECIES: hypothetical protein [Rhodoplanes]MDC7784800.1 hypothetical protein [Rhodoplanes tepidamans]MDC7982267.1 hypothetical protein [Rhodoplanes sp. TEM]MDQ0356274.1 hypothetical protein [Rhodoplanes tepidamans]
MGVCWVKRGRLRPYGLEFGEREMPRFEVARWRNQGRVCRPYRRLGWTPNWQRVLEDQHERRRCPGRLGEWPHWRPFFAKPRRRANRSKR